MNSLSTVLYTLNIYPSTEKWDQYKHPINQAQLDELAIQLCNGLADENLYQDGECTPEEALERYEEIMTAASSLNQYAEYYQLKQREISEEYA
jgi:hypothetical protein